MGSLGPTRWRRAEETCSERDSTRARRCAVLCIVIVVVRRVVGRVQKVSGQSVGFNPRWISCFTSLLI